MAERRANWTAESREDLLQVVDFIAFDNPLSAQRILNRLRSRALSLARSAERGRVGPELRGTWFPAASRIDRNPVAYVLLH